MSVVGGEGVTVAKGSSFTRADPIGASVRAGELGSPVAVLRGAAVEHNAATMAEFCRRAGAELMPHAKTTMAPELVALQLRHGATGMTAAVPWQAARLWDWGVGHVLLANEVTDPDGLRGLLARRTPERSLWWYLDSVDGLDLAVAAVRAVGGPPAEVLVELGHAGGRTGVRTAEAGIALVRRAAACPELRVVGVAGYEGTIGQRRDPDTEATVRTYLAELHRLVDAVAAFGEPGATPVVTVGGSTFFDRVVEAFGRSGSARATAAASRLVLRSGCYLTHDHGLYERTSPATQPGWTLPPFEAAVEVWTRVVSRPEPGLLLLNAGRRDVSFDAGLPVPLRRVAVHEPGEPDATVEGWRVTALGDQHAFVEVPSTDRARPGDLVALGISHPCTTFDKWARFHVVDDDGRVTGEIRTEFA